MSYSRSFEDDLKTGQRGEDLLEKHLFKLCKVVINRMLYEKNERERQAQRDGVDFEMEITNYTFNSKCRAAYSHQFKDILLETISVFHDNNPYWKPGWVYEDEPGYIIYLWWGDETETWIMDGYLLYMKNIKEWFIGKHEEYEIHITSSEDNMMRKWKSQSRIIPISAFPDGCIERISKENIKMLDDRKTPEPPEPTEVQKNLKKLLGEL